MRPAPTGRRTWRARRAIHTNGPVAGAFRGFGVPQAAIAQETLYDRLAEARASTGWSSAGNALRDGDATATGQVLRGRRHRRLPRGAAPALGAGAGRGGEAQRPGGGRAAASGVASCWYGCGNTALPNPSTIRIG
jgi:aldehyde oxidoreductase